MPCSMGLPGGDQNGRGFMAHIICKLFTANCLLARLPGRYSFYGKTCFLHFSILLHSENLGFLKKNPVATLEKATRATRSAPFYTAKTGISGEEFVVK